MEARTSPGRPAEAAIDLDGHDPSLGQLIARTTSDFTALVRDEIELAKVEIKEEVTTASKAGALLGGAGLMGYLAFTLLCFAAAWGLSEVVPEGVAFLIVGVVIGLVAAVLYLVGRRRLEKFEPVPRQTVETIQEDVQWAKQLKN